MLRGPTCLSSQVSFIQTIEVRPFLRWCLSMITWKDPRNHYFIAIRAICTHSRFSRHTPNSIVWQFNINLTRHSIANPWGYRYLPRSPLPPVLRRLLVHLEPNQPQVHIGTNHTGSNSKARSDSLFMTHATLCWKRFTKMKVNEPRRHTLILQRWYCPPLGDTVDAETKAASALNPELWRESAWQTWSMPEHPE